MNFTEARSHFGLWVITSSPLILGLDLRDTVKGRTQLERRKAAKQSTLLVPSSIPAPLSAGCLCRQGPRAITDVGAVHTLWLWRWL